MKWPVGRLIWEARGHRFKFVSATLQERFGEGFSQPTLQRLSTKVDADVPDEVATIILGLPIRRGFEDPAEVVRAGLEALGQAGPQAVDASVGSKLPGVDPEVIAGAIASSLRRKLPQLDPEVIANGIAAVLAEKLPRVDPEALAKALVAQLLADTGEGSPWGKLARHLASLLGFSMLRATLNHTDAKVDVVVARLEGQGLQLRRIHATLKLLVGAVCVGLLLQCHRPSINVSIGGPGDSAPARGGGVAGEAAGGRSYWALPPFLASFLAGQTGEKTPPELFVPDHPLPHQKLPPCDSALREEVLGGGCWTAIDGVPPCGRLYRFGNKCYRPIAENPLKPMGGDPEQGPRREGGGMPGREQEQSGHELR